MIPETAPASLGADRHVPRFQLIGTEYGWILLEDGTPLNRTDEPTEPGQALGWANHEIYQVTGYSVRWQNLAGGSARKSKSWVATPGPDTNSSLPLLVSLVLLVAATAATLIGTGGSSATGNAGAAGALFAALFAAHLVADFWIQTGAQSLHKGDVAGPFTGPNRLPWSLWWQGNGRGWAANLGHVTTYTLTAAAAVAAVAWHTGLHLDWWHVGAGLAISALSHAWADRRHTLCWLAHALGRGEFYDTRVSGLSGAFWLDQSWHAGWLLVAVLIAS